MKFTDKHINKQHRFSMGTEETTGYHFLSIPVSNSLCDYEEYYRIEPVMMDNYSNNLKEVIAFVSDCKIKKNDHLLFLKPGKDRGTAS